MKDVWRQFLHALWPERCAGCDAIVPVDPHGFCPDCAERLIFWHNPPDSPVRHVARYEGPLRQALCRYKYGKKRSCAGKFARLAAGIVADGDFPACEVLVPVPLHWRKVFSRGFNQSQMIALHLGRCTGLPVLTGVLVRTAGAASQTGLDHRARLKNVRNCFAVRSPAAVREKTVLLLDDVYTTGATTGEAARALRRAGAKRVVILTIAKS